MSRPSDIKGARVSTEEEMTRGITGVGEAQISKQLDDLICQTDQVLDSEVLGQVLKNPEG